MNWGELIGLGLLASNLAWTIGWSILMRNQVAAARNDNRFNDHGNRIVKLEAAVEHLPRRVASHEDVEGVHERVSDVRDELSKVATAVAGMAGSLNGIEKNIALLNRSEFTRERDDR